MEIEKLHFFSLNLRCRYPSAWAGRHHRFPLGEPFLCLRDASSLFAWGRTGGPVGSVRKPYRSRLKIV